MNFNQFFTAHYLIATKTKLRGLILVTFIVDDALYLPMSMGATHPRDKGSTFLAQSVFCFGPFLAGYLTRNVPWEYLFTEATFIETQAIFCRDYLLKRL